MHSDPAAPTNATPELRRYRGDHGAHVHAHAQVLIVPAGLSHSSATRHGAGVCVVDTAAAGLDRLQAFAWAGRGAVHAPSVTAWLDWARGAPRMPPRRRLEVAALERAVAAALHEAWPVTRLAACVALSVPQFHARWRALTGQTPQAWLRDLRLNAAERLLRAGWPGDTVAAQVGYFSASALLHALRRERSTGPRHLRRG